MTRPGRTEHGPPARPPGHAHSEHAPGRQGPVIAAVAVGGSLGAAARYGIESLWPVHGADFPWPILIVNASGCLVMGALMTFLAGRSAPVERLGGALLGTGFLGGYTTFSHYTDNIRVLVSDGDAATAAVYLLLTVVAALLGVWAGAAVVRAVLPGPRPGGAR